MPVMPAMPSPEPSSNLARHQHTDLPQPIGSVVWVEDEFATYFRSDLDGDAAEWLRQARRRRLRIRLSIALVGLLTATVVLWAAGVLGGHHLAGTPTTAPPPVQVPVRVGGPPVGQGQIDPTATYVPVPAGTATSPAGTGTP
jgi:hypothetical protein